MPPRRRAAAAAASAPGVFDGEVFCVSGSFSRTQNELKELIIKHGGSCVATPNKQCTFVVSDAIGSQKTVKARDDGIDIVTEQWVEESIRDGKLSRNKKLFLHGPSDDAAAAVAPAGDDEEEEEEEEEEDKKKKKKAPAKKAPAKRAGSKRKQAADDDDDDKDDDDKKDASKADDDDDDDKSAAAAPPKKATKKSAGSTASSSGAAAAASSGSGSGSGSGANIKKVVVKGSAPVDELCPQAHHAHVFADASGVYDAMMNQTNIGNNNNKFYVVQLLESDSSPRSYWVWTRWGRVGAAGQNALFPCGSSLDSAKAQFNSKFHDKTRNHWSNRDSFVSYPGKYTLLQRDYSADDDDDMQAPADDAQDESKPQPKSKLDPRVQDLIKLICDLKMMKEAMIEVGYDADKLPLGKLSKDHIKKGYQVLQEISSALDDGKRNRLMDLSNQFYSLIPHKTPGMRPPPVINSQDLLKEKLQLVESLGEVAVATSLLRQPSTGPADDRHIVDIHYEKLKCDFTPLAKDSAEFKTVEDYTRNTHGHTHRMYDLEVMDVFDLQRHGEADRFTEAGHHKTGNRQLLWHGSRLTNFVGIISQGLRIAPPEAPVTGYMFGKGVYFANMVSKSANYCFTNRHSNVACLLLCEVALGDMNELKRADFNASSLPAGKLSTKGLGKHIPDPSMDKVLDDGLIVPLGKETQSSFNDTSLLYDEFIVYNVAQVRMKYLVKMKFKY